MDDLARVRSEINRYCDLYFICPRFEPSELVTIDDLRQKKPGVPWPNGDEAGCHVMYSEHGGLLYIGLARSAHVSTNGSGTTNGKISPLSGPALLKATGMNNLNAFRRSR
jgi:hypothetical protein